MSAVDQKTVASHEGGGPDQQFMSRALQLAEKGLFTASPNPRVGCVLVKKGRIVGEGWHHSAGSPHAEIQALNNCSEDPKGATAYVTLEPCAHYGRTPPCCDRLVAVGIERVVIAATDPNPLVEGKGISRMREAGIEVSSGLMAVDSHQLNCGFFSRMQRKRPWVRVKLAASLDGRTALGSGVSKWITSSQARVDVQSYRARADCILTGIGTVLADNPKMTVRLVGSLDNPPDEHRQPMLAIVDSRGQTPVDATVFQADREVLIFSQTDVPIGEAVVLANALKGGQICLSSMMQELAKREINEVHVEAGAKLVAGLLAEQLIDELIVYQAPLLLGSDARALVALTGLTSMDQRIDFEYTDISRVGRDLRLTLRPCYSHNSTDPLL